MACEVQLTLSNLKLVLLTLICNLHYALGFFPLSISLGIVLVLFFSSLESTLKCASSVIPEVSLIH